jgi:hypothetical protein
VLNLAAEGAAGAIPYLTTVEHSRDARQVRGGGPFLAPEHKVNWVMTGRTGIVDGAFLLGGRGDACAGPADRPSDVGLLSPAVGKGGGRAPMGPEIADLARMAGPTVVALVAGQA